MFHDRISTPFFCFFFATWLLPEPICAEPIRAEKPNLIFVLSDDIAQGDLGVYGQKLIQTPNLDRLCNEGTRYHSAYTGTSVCAPARTSFFTGLHMGHCPTRANREIKPEGQRPLPPDTVTIAKILKSAGYKTATMGKWGMGMFDTSGNPFKNGVDHFFGYNCQRHAHSYFPPYLYNDDQRFEIAENANGKKAVYAQELIQQDVLKWLDQNAEEPFFLFYAITLPHGRYEIDDQGIYADKPWTEQEKNYAAMVTRIDSDMGALVDLLEKKEIADNTLIVFSGDNGSSFNPATAIGKRFNQTMNGKLRGYKRGMYEGALRQAAFAWWPGTVAAGRVTDEPWAFWDLLPTFAELAQAEMPPGFKTDGLSLVGFLKGGAAPKRDYFYWELHEAAGPIQAIRWENWKAVRPSPGGKVELYDLSNDLAESKDLSEIHPDLIAQAIQWMSQARTDHPDWPDPATASPKKKKGKTSSIKEAVQGRFDIGVGIEALAKLNPYVNGCPPELLQKQAKQYAKLFDLFQKYEDVILRVSFWNIHDGESWLNHFPWQRVNYPLLFDRNLKPKPAYHAVLKSLTSKRE